MPRYAVIKRETLNGPIFYVAPGELILGDDEESVFISSDLEEVALHKEAMEAGEPIMNPVEEEEPKSIEVCPSIELKQLLGGKL